MHPLIAEVIAWKEAPRQDVLRRIQQQLPLQIQPILDEHDRLVVRVAELEADNAKLKARPKVA